MVVIGGETMNDGRMIWLVSLDDGFGGGEVAAADTPDNLGEELEGAFFGGKIGKGKTSISLDDADSGKIWKIESFGDGLGADNDLIFAAFDLRVEVVERFLLGIITIKASDLSVGEKFAELGFEELGAEAFVDDMRVVAV